MRLRQPEKILPSLPSGLALIPQALLNSGDGMDEIRHLSDEELRAWWTERLTALAAEGDEERRVASLISALRALQQADADERRRLTRARMRAAIALPPAVRDLVFATRAAAARREPALDAEDNAIVAELIPTIPEAAGFRPPGN